MARSTSFDLYSLRCRLPHGTSSTTRLDDEHLAQPVADRLRERRVGRRPRAELDAHGQRRLLLHACRLRPDQDLAADVGGERAHDLADRGREDVDAADDQHVVGAPDAPHRAGPCGRTGTGSSTPRRGRACGSAAAAPRGGGDASARARRSRRRPARARRRSRGRSARRGRSRARRGAFRPAPRTRPRARRRCRRSPSPRSPSRPSPPRASRGTPARRRRAHPRRGRARRSSRAGRGSRPGYAA